MVTNAAGNSGEMWVCRGKEVERYMRREDFLREGRSEKRGQAALEDSQG